MKRASVRDMRFGFTDPLLLSMEGSAAMVSVAFALQENGNEPST
jgi:hypothetical protein